MDFSLLLGVQGYKVFIVYFVLLCLCLEVLFEVFVNVVFYDLVHEVSDLMDPLLLNIKCSKLLGLQEILPLKIVVLPYVVSFVEYHREDSEVL
jgi:hypothetical protein